MCADHHHALNDFMKEVSDEMREAHPHADETMLIREHMHARRKLLSVQEQADNIKAKLCDRIRAEKPQTLADRIARFEYTDAELFNYIRKLEFINVGIWCPKCYMLKQLQGKPADYEAVLAAPVGEPITDAPVVPTGTVPDALSVSSADLLRPSRAI